MKRWVYYSVLVLLFSLMDIPGYGQSTISSWRCDSAVGMCAVQSYSFAAAVNGGSAPVGPYYGCLTSQPNATWFFMQIQNAGTMKVKIKTAPARDVDYVLWGPFNTPLYQCDTGLTASRLISCDTTRSTSANSFYLNGASANLYYIILVSNYSNQNSTISFDVDSGNATANCDVQCNLYGITANVSACDTGANLGKYRVTGSISTYLYPTSGTLTISSSCGGSVSYNAPFSTTMNYTMPYVSGTGQTCTITAVYSAIPSCARSATITAATCCSVTPCANQTVCEGQTLQLSATGTSGGVYHWSGPASFSSSVADPSISQVSGSNAGSYQVYLTNGGCTTDIKTVDVTINPKPAVKSILHE